MRKYWWVFVLAAAAAFVFLYQSDFNPYATGLDKSTWKEYKDDASGYSIRHPESWGGTKSSDRTYFYGDGNSVRMEAYTTTNSDLTDFSYLKFPQDGKVTIEDREFVEFKAPEGYCEEGRCGRPFSAYSVKAKNGVLTFIFYGDDDLSTEEKAVLGTLVLQ